METRKATVFVIQEGPHDYTPAMEYGNIDVLTTGEITGTPLEISPRNSGLIERLRARLVDYIPGVDYILLSGSPVAIAWTFFLIGRTTGSAAHQLLKWDAQARRYTPYVLDAKVLP